MRLEVKLRELLEKGQGKTRERLLTAWIAREKEIEPRVNESLRAEEIEVLWMMAEGDGRKENNWGSLGKR